MTRVVKNPKVFRNALLNLVLDIIRKEELSEEQKCSLISKIELIKNCEPIIELES